MANYYTETAFIIPLTKEQTSFANEVIECVHDRKVDFTSELIPDSYGKEVYELAKILAIELIEIGETDFDFDTEVRDEGLYVAHDESINSNIATLLAHLLLKHFDLDIAIPVEFSHTCSKANIGAFGGFAAFVTKEDISWFSTRDWVEQQMAKFNASKNQTVMER